MIGTFPPSADPNFKPPMMGIMGFDPQLITTNSSTGLAAVTWTKPFKTPPFVQATVLGDGTQSLQARSVEVFNVTATGCTVRTWVTRGSIVLSMGPVQLVGAGVYITAFGEAA